MKELKEFSSEEEYVPRSIQYIVVHCSATRANIPFTEEQLLKCHLQRGFKYIGYHFYITRDGELHHCRPVSEPGAHVRGFNQHDTLHSGRLLQEGQRESTLKNVWYCLIMREHWKSMRICRSCPACIGKQPLR